MHEIKQITLTQKQKETNLEALKHKVAVYCGSIRSGKTFSQTQLFSVLLYLEKEQPTDAYDIVVGKTKATALTNTMPIFRALFGGNNVKEGEHSKTQAIKLFEGTPMQRICLVYGANDKNSFEFIRGKTVRYVLADEVTLWVEGYFKEMLGRCSYPGSKVLASTNPDHPNHEFKKYIDKPKNKVYSVQFTLDDNTFLDPDYVEWIKSTYDGLFYDRLILGKWVAGKGTIYDMFHPSKHVIKEKDTPTIFNDYYISIDYGTMNPFAMGMFGENNQNYYHLKGYFYNGREKLAQKTDEDYCSDVLKFMEGYYETRKLEGIIIDPSATSFITALTRRLSEEDIEVPIIKANNDVLDGIKTQMRMLKQKRYFIVENESNQDVINEYYSYQWDENKSSRTGIDEPRKEHDHTKDYERYFFNHKEAFKSSMLNIRI